ncbi:MAG: SDR family NAD(P)-dependent oxidoreductase [Deltaproteobacteria bacterium]|nr:MAG: SDR family NAD(P)-dependent oxidoreductase [Deltaproteobacteria bacterium]
MTRQTHAWSTADIVDQTGKTFLITGANSGIGLEAVRPLAAQGARILMACRNLEKAARAKASVLEQSPSADLQIVPLDLSDLDSVRRCVDEAAERVDHLDVLINNAGIMAIPRRETAQGFEMQLGTNHLGHFALTGLLLPLLRSQGQRVVTISSQAHRMGSMHFDDLQLARGYGEWKAYGQSKLANLLFAFELERRFRAAELGLISVAAHPGYADTDLQHVGPRVKGSKLMDRAMGFFNRNVAQSAADGALPTLRAAVDPDVQGGDYYGPSGIMEVAGPPVRVGASTKARDGELAARLWTMSEELTGVSYDL